MAHLLICISMMSDLNKTFKRWSRFWASYTWLLIAATKKNGSWGLPIISDEGVVVRFHIYPASMDTVCESSLHMWTSMFNTGLTQYAGMNLISFDWFQFWHCFYWLIPFCTSTSHFGVYLDPLCVSRILVQARFAKSLFSSTFSLSAPRCR